ncbi:MAG: LamG-like jellyroll fold domain-containing protein [Bacteroidales bacterium]
MWRSWTSETVNPAQTTSVINSFGHTELLEFGLTVKQDSGSTYQNSSYDSDLEYNRDIIYLLNKETEAYQYNRTEYGVQMVYRFDEGGGGTVHDKSASGDPVDLHIDRPEDVEWVPGKGLKMTGNATLSSSVVPRDFLAAIQATDEISIETWIRTDDITQTGPARIVSLSTDSDNRVVMLGQEGTAAFYDYVARLNTGNDANGLPQVTTPTHYQSKNLHHVVYSRTYLGVEKIHVNGVAVYTGTRAGDFSDLSGDFYLALGNEVGGGSPWTGTYYLVALYNRALFDEEIAQNYAAGLGTIRYTTSLDIDPNESYTLTPFVLTDQGIIYGEPSSLFLENVLFNTEEDSIYMAIYPNPSQGEFELYVECAATKTSPAYLQVSDLMGHVLFYEEVNMEGKCMNPADLEEVAGLETFVGEEGISRHQVNLSALLHEGIYSLILVVGDKAVARKLIIY